jgi:hypothetical protein
MSHRCVLDRLRLNQVSSCVDDIIAPERNPGEMSRYDLSEGSKVTGSGAMKRFASGESASSAPGPFENTREAYLRGILVATKGIFLSRANSMMRR